MLCVRKAWINGHRNNTDAGFIGDVEGDELLAEIVRAAGDDARLSKRETRERTRPARATQQFNICTVRRNYKRDVGEFGNDSADETTRQPPVRVQELSLLLAGGSRRSTNIGNQKTRKENFATETARNLFLHNARICKRFLRVGRVMKTRDGDLTYRFCISQPRGVGGDDLYLYSFAYALEQMQQKRAERIVRGARKNMSQEGDTHYGLG